MWESRPLKIRSTISGRGRSVRNERSGHAPCGRKRYFNANLDAGAASDAAAAQTRNVSALINAGARTILIANLPNLGATPRFNGDVTTAEAGLVATNTFNGELATGIGEIAAVKLDANLIQADLQGFLNIAIANSEAFGFVNRA